MRTHPGLCFIAIRAVPVLLCVSFLSCPLSPQNAALTIPRNLLQLVDESERIVQGRVTNVTLEPHAQLSNLMAVAVTLQVEDNLKGTALSLYTFHQVAIDRRDQQELLGYRPGQHVLLILMRPSVYGLSSPAGLQQGRFSLRTRADGKLEAVNGFSNGGLFREMDSQLAARGVRIQPEVRALLAQQKPGPAPLNELKTLIRSITTSTQPQ